ncbi:MAG: ATP-binding protein [Spirochaetes bacterium]|nr:ATP-binding protein [Spirochaetota bacterium]
MRELVVISGKGGTGKTSIAACFAALAERKVMVDCDVDAADLHLVLSPVVTRTEAFQGGWVAINDRSLCIGCGDCTIYCRYGAIMDFYEIDPLRCEGCGVCAEFCPHGAIEMQRRDSGSWFLSDTPHGPLVHARLNIAEGNSGKLVSLLKEEARKIAQERGYGLIIADGSPGIGCPVISSLAGASAALIVTEPTPSGMHDLERISALTAQFRIQTYVCVNRFDVNREMTDGIVDWCNERTIPMIGKIPFDLDFNRAQGAGTTMAEFSFGAASYEIAHIWGTISREL